ncbi:MAG TPA: hypothetical protein DD725_11340 [Deltaproteobacteria bacterium]|nr:MAG: hypothetical protein A2Z89_03555 [Deltaproteobacteria bacterium GWA2_43_19]OGQ10797.1 MAG: hypothetical protein A3D30_08250 [Deltaproteobacteria bacterium RIFCSPHIGHO2_02_FULL_43_33]OGQ33780.1 MAG: hypothetical protein A3A85_00585 [Deltaproteobacteria bacterium RIFCSPLOWO2_01_FULL_42_9]HBR18176.1 hypothetical protein [Deltaproteobacteria bacterium]
MNVVLNKQSSEDVGELIDLAMKNSLMKHPEGTLITQEMINELVNEVMNQITPFLLRNLKVKKIV